jgi:hypothetical protein
MSGASRSSILLLALGLWAAWAPGTAVAPPALTISPGSPDSHSLVLDSCPTFTWTSEPGASGYELQIVRIDDEPPDSPSLRVEIPTAAIAWTPSGDSCMESGGAYAWRVRAGGSTTGEWSPLRLFRIAGGAWLDSLLEETVLRIVRQARIARAIGSPGSGPYASLDGGLASSAQSPTPPAGSGSIYTNGSLPYGVWGVGDTAGIWGEAGSTAGFGISATLFPGTGAPLTAIYGSTNSPVGYGAAGWGRVIGVYGLSSSANGRGVSGEHNPTLSPAGSLGCGTKGRSYSADGVGVEGRATATSGTNVGVFGASNSTGGADFRASEFNGNVNFGPFTGSHEVRVDPDSGRIAPGMVVSVTGRAESRLAPDGTLDLSSTLPTVSLSMTPEDPAVLGAFVSEISLVAGHWFAESGARFGNVNALGEGRVWVTDINGPPALGDYLTTSPIPGYAQRQRDPRAHAYTLGKVTEALDWNGISPTVVHDGTRYRAALISVVYTSG